MKILGIDPGLNITGYGLIEASSVDKIKVIEAGVIRTSGALKIQQRLKKIYNTLDCIIEENKPEVIVLEKIYAHYKHPTTAILMGHARGITCLLAGIKNISLVNYPASRIKKAVTGNGSASKRQVQTNVTDLLKLKKAPEPVDVTDALAIAMSYVYMEMMGN